MTEENLHVKYELMVILDPNLGEETATKEVEKLKGEIKDLEGKITNDDFWGIRDLSYRIKRERRGYYAVLNFGMDPSKTKEFEKDLTLNQAVLRYLLIKTPNYYEFRTFMDLQKEAEEISKKKAEAAKEKEEQKEGKRLKFARKPARKTEVKEEVPVKKVKKEMVDSAAEQTAPAVHTVHEPKKEMVEEIEEEIKKQMAKPSSEPKATESKPEPKVKLSDKSALEDFDAKLKSIIDDPDITL
jgi:small subunit ribosomal protein S6